MLTNVPTAIRQLHRATVLNHPNSWGGYILRKQVDRTGEIVGGLPTLGGLSVLNSEDEENISYHHVGNVVVLSGEQYAVAPLHDRADVEMGGIDTFTFLIEPEELGMEIKGRDVLYLVIGADFEKSPKIAYEIVGTTTTTHIPPYLPKYLCNRRAEMDLN